MADGLGVDVIEESHDVVVLTQSCDLENDKVTDVLVAAVLDYRILVEREAAANPSVKSTKFREAAVKGNLPPYSLLPQRLEHPAIAWSLVDFHHLFSIPKVLVEQIAGVAGDRLRLRSPYREHLAQAFARYVMRVGLPHPLHEFTKAAVD